MAKKAGKCPKMAKNDTFCLITFDPSIVFSETRSKCGGNCTKYKTTVTDLGKILVHVPRGHLGLKNTPFGVVFFKFVELLICMSF